MSLKPWRELVSPHRDVLEGIFRQSEFTVDIAAVHRGESTREYQEAAAFFDRTFLTEGMRWLITQVALCLTDQGGEPVIQIQSPPGGGKTHSLLAAYHLITRQCPLGELIGIPDLLDSVGGGDVPQARVVVLDGVAHSPTQHWKHEQRIVRTLWGEFAWQLGGETAFARVLDADATGTSPSKGILEEFLETYAPCVILLDDFLSYVQQIPEGQTLSGGSYESNLSFVQSLAEVVKRVPTTMLVASLPQPREGMGQVRELAALHAMDKVFQRTKSAWRPPFAEELVGIVGCRLFDPVRDPLAQETVCRAFTKLYEDEAARLPTEIQEGRYLDRLIRTYPLHPEWFDRMSGDWMTVADFPYLRGMLKCTAQILFRLWKNNNRDLLILPGSLPLYDACSRDALTRYLSPGWDVLIHHDIDGDGAVTDTVDHHDPRFGLVNAAHRVARSVFWGSAPLGASRGLEHTRILLGCLQPGQTASIYLEALVQWMERTRYLGRSSEKLQDDTCFWFELPTTLHPVPRQQTPPTFHAPNTRVVSPSATDTSLRATIEIPAATIVQLASVLASDARATVQLTVELSIVPSNDPS